MKKNQNLKIFIVEDNLIYQQLIAKELESISADIHFFTKGETCIAALNLNPSIIVLDYDLAGTINGLDTLKSIREFNPNIYTVLFSNQQGLACEKNYSTYGLFDFVEKKETGFYNLKEKITSSYVTC